MKISSKTEGATSASSITDKAGCKTKTTTTKAATATPDLQDTFTQQTQEAQERHLKMEHLAKLQVQERLHTTKIAALFAQLHTQLASIWNEVWMQRQKVHEENYKNWLKLLLS